MSDAPIVNDATSRKKSIIENTPAIFEISSNAAANANAPWHEIKSKSKINTWCGLIIQISNKHQIVITLLARRK